MDRLVYQSHRLELIGESMRKKRGQQSMFDDQISNQVKKLKKKLNLN